jgi:hypothetical protein
VSITVIARFSAAQGSLPKLVFDAARHGKGWMCGLRSEKQSSRAKLVVGA